MIANVLGLPFLGFALTIAIGSPLLDYIGMGLLLPLSGICFTAGALIIMFAGSLATGPGVYTVIWVGALVTGIGWGLVETVVNPLIASLYPEEKTAQAKHAARVVARRSRDRRPAWGRDVWRRPGVAGQALRRDPAGARVSSHSRASACRFPPTERAAAGVSMGEMFRELLNPLFIVLFLFDVPDGRLRARARSVGRLRAQPHGAHARHPAARVRERADVRHAPFRGPAGAQAVADRVAVGVVPDGDRSAWSRSASPTRRSRVCSRRHYGARASVTCGRRCWRRRRSGFPAAARC